MKIHAISNTTNNKYERGQSFGFSALFSDIGGKYKKINVNSGEYIKYIYSLSRKMCRQTCEINVEQGAIQKLVAKKEPAIFIMNHTKTQSRDIDAAIFFNTLLYREYLYHGMEENCLHSKIMTGKGFLKRLEDGGKKLEWMGAVPVSNSMKPEGKKENAVMLKELIQEFVQDKINIFLFPEGALAALTFLPAKYKFQPGVSSIVKNVLDTKPNVKVIPLGFAHNKKLSSIHIGEPVYFKKTENGYTTSRGNASSEFFDKPLANFYSDSEEKLITDNGVAVKKEKLVPYISGILLKNLECCTKEAEKDLKNSEPKVFVI